MTKKEMKAFVEAVKVARTLVSDELAATIPALYPSWREGVTYAAGERVLHNEVLYKILSDHTSQADWTPDVAASLFAKALIPNEDEIPAWEQPESTNPYKAGDKVTHNGVTWVSDINVNTWEPGVYGWSQVK